MKCNGLSEDEIKYFLEVPNDDYLQSPKWLDNMDKAAALFDEIIKLGANERICVVVDSDVDGFTSAAIFIQYLRKFNTEVQIDYILHKHSSGYSSRLFK